MATHDGFWQVLSEGRVPDSFVKGLQLTKWAGRAEVIHDPSGRLSFYLDGAHSPESMEACANWFCSTIQAEGNSKVAEPNNSSQLSILGTDDEKWNSRGTMVKRVSTSTCEDSCFKSDFKGYSLSLFLFSVFHLDTPVVACLSPVLVWIPGSFIQLHA